jgi:hypothetical protein
MSLEFGLFGNPGTGERVRVHGACATSIQKPRLPLRSLRDEIAVTRDRYGSCVTSVAGPDGGATLYEK